MELEEIPSMDPEYIQFGCAEWFWEKQVNSYALQVEPARFMTRDRAIVGYREVLHIEKFKRDVFAKLYTIILKFKENDRNRTQTHSFELHSNRGQKGI